MADGLWRFIFGRAPSNTARPTALSAPARPEPAQAAPVVRPNVSRMDPRYPMGPGAVESGRVRTAFNAPEEPATSAGQARSRESGTRAGELAFRSRYQPRYVEPLALADGSVPDLDPNLPLGPGGVSSDDPVTRAAAVTGLSTRFLNALTGHESGGDDNARAPTSSASGAAQFIDDTWARMMRQYGPRYGLDASISRRDLLRLRQDRGWSTLMAAEYALENRREMEPALGREIRENEAYLGHFLGAGDAVRLIRAAERNARNAAALFPGAARANGRVFYVGGRYDQAGHYLGGGRPATAREVYDRQSRAFSRERLGGRQ